MAAIAIALLLITSACAADPVSRDGADDAGPVSGPILVSAAASLTDAFREIASAFEAAHPGTTVELNLAGSSSLREQILAGAPVDVFAAADTADVEAIGGAGLATGRPVVFARNTLRIAVPAGNPGKVAGMQSLADPALFIGLCIEAAPCGRLARQALANAGVTASVDTNEPDVRALVTKIAAGELDAGITYATDVLAAGDAVLGITLPADVNVTVPYPIVALAGAPNPRTAAAFVTFVTSPRAQEILRARGFTTP